MKIKSIISGCNQIIDNYFELTDIGKSPHYDHKKSYIRLSGTPKNDLDFSELISNLYKQIQNNRELSISAYGKLPSRENWRFQKQIEIDSKNSSPEVTLERKLVNVFNGSLVNQIPTSSGLVGSRQDKVRNIDLVMRNNSYEYEFIELKVDSNTPLYAAMEILLYGLLYIFTREHMQEFEYDSNDKTLLSANSIQLIPLAPFHYYPYHIQWIERKINDGLQQFIKSEVGIDLNMDFTFQSFPKDFRWPLVDKNLSDDELVQVMNDRFPIYQ